MEDGLDMGITLTLYDAFTNPARGISSSMNSLESQARLWLIEWTWGDRQDATSLFRCVGRYGIGFTFHKIAQGN